MFFFSCFLVSTFYAIISTSLSPFYYFTTNLNQNLFFPFISMFCIIQFIVHLRQLVLKVSDLSLVFFLLHLHLKKPHQKKSEGIFFFSYQNTNLFFQVVKKIKIKLKSTLIYSHVPHRGTGHEAEKWNIREEKVRAILNR